MRLPRGVVPIAQQESAGRATIAAGTPTTTMKNAPVGWKGRNTGERLPSFAQSPGTGRGCRNSSSLWADS